MTEFKECKECAEIPDELLRGSNARWCSDGHIWIPAVIKTGQYEKSVDIRACDDKVLTNETRSQCLAHKILVRVAQTIGTTPTTITK